MPVYTSSINGYQVVWYKQEITNHYNKHISKLIKDKFGEGPFLSFGETNEILHFLNEGLIGQFKCTMMQETSLAFYQYIQILHEQSNEIAIERKFSSHFTQITETDFVLYRRVLKFILEQACHLELIYAESLDDAKKRVPDFLEELIYIGDLLFSNSNLIASQQLIEDAVEIFFNTDELYIIDYKHHYNAIIEEIKKDIDNHFKKSISDTNAINDFNQALIKCFGASFYDVIREAKSMHQYSKDHNKEPYPCASSFDLKSLIENLSHNSQISTTQAEAIISGLILNKETKCSFTDAFYKPQSIQRYLYRPFLQWNIKGFATPMILVGICSLEMALERLAINAISWNKYPSEWNCECFNNYVKQKQESNDKILEDALEIVLKEHNVVYSRNLTSLKKKNNQNLSIIHEDCGEIDFLFIFNNKIYIADSKHLLARYDFNNWRNDYATFETNKNNYNDTISNKLKYLGSRKALIEEHFEVENPGESFSLVHNKLEGIFLINNPTFYMYNSKYKIFTTTDFERFLQGGYVYPKFHITEHDGDNVRTYIIKHPYFKKPEYLVFDEED
jgi:hypothetical protein